MKVDGVLLSSGLQGVPAVARELEELGYDGAFSAETAHEPFFPLLLAAEHTERLELITGIAVAFARNPMTLANVGYDLQAYSQGRFVLGLGSQIKAHIEKRFSMPWSHPAARMRELILAMRAIWASWNDGDKLDFRGEFYRHTLMTPFFNPGPNPYGVPRVFLAAVGARMTEVAGEVADGILLHGFTTERYVREVTLPALERGWA
ncbi:MAG: TIGR03617 family F420-dependent LLM class oxidoreductase, partial [Acidimicrobiia bacterium]